MLVNGQWQGDWQPVQAKDKDGRFLRQTSSVRHWVTADGAAGPTGEGGFKAEAGRYRLYVALICPWASRTLMARSLKGLEEIIPVSVVNPVLTSEGWAFGGYPGSDAEPQHGFTHMHQLYTHAVPDYTGRATVPVLWDMKTDRMVNNESADILAMFDTAFADLVPATQALRPAALVDQIDALNSVIYDGLNNGVYKAGFAQSQLAYDEAVGNVFATLDMLEERLAEGPYLFGAALTESDIRTFVTLIRFDAAYVGAFKTNRRQIKDYPRLSVYMERILRLPGIAQTVDIGHIKAGYYSIKSLNPTGIIPAGPDHITKLMADVAARG